MANTRFKTENGLHVAAGNAQFDQTAQFNANVSVSADLFYVGANLYVQGTQVFVGGQQYATDLEATVANLKLGNTTYQWDGFFDNVLVYGDLNPSANGIAFGTTTRRWNITANGADFANTLNVTGAVTFANTLTVTGVVNVASNLNIGTFGTTNGINITNTSIVVGNSTANATLAYNLIQASNTTSIANLTPTTLTIGSTTLNSSTINVASLVISGAGNVQTTLGIGGAANALSTLGVTGATTLANTLSVTGAATFANTISVTGNASIGGNVTISGTSHTIQGNTNFKSGVLYVDAFNNRVGIGNTAPDTGLTVGTAANVIGAAQFANIVGIIGAATLSNTINVTGAATFSNTIAVTNTATFSNTTAHTGTATFANTVGVTGAATLSNTLNVTGTGTFSNTLGVTGAATFSNTIAVTNTATFSNTLNVTGAVTFANTLGVTGSVILSNDLTISGNLIVSGTTTYVNTATLNIADNTITLNADLPAITAPTENAGIEVNRGSVANVELRWNETNDIWELTSDGLSYYKIIDQGTANSNFDSGVLFVDAVNNRVGINNTAPAVALRVTGAVDISSAANVQGNANVGGTLGIGGAANALSTLGVNGLITGAAGLTVTGTTNTSVAINVGGGVATTNGATITNTSIIVGNSTANATLAFNLIQSSNSTGTSTLAPTYISAATINATSNLNIGTFPAVTNGVFVNTSIIRLGNSSANALINSTSFYTTYFSGRYSTILSTSTFNGFDAISAGGRVRADTTATAYIDVYDGSSITTTVGPSYITITPTSTGIPLFSTNTTLTNTVSLRAVSNLNVGAFGTTNGINITNTNVLVGNSTANALISASSLLLTNSTSNIQLSIPSSAQWTNGNYYLNANGSWSLVVSAPSGGNTEIQFNDSGSFNGNSWFTFNKLTTLLTVGNSTVNTIANGSFIRTASLNATTDVNVGTFGTTNGVTITNTSIVVGNSTANATHAFNLLQAANSTFTANLSPSTLTIGTTTVNGSYINVGTLFVTGAGNVQSTFGIAGAANALSTFGVNGLLTTAGGISISNTITANGTTGTAGFVLTTGGAGSNVYWAQGSGGGFSASDDTATNATYYPLVATTAGGSTAKTSSTKFTFNPSTGTLSATTFNSLSDEKYKENIKLIENSIDILKQVEGVSFDWKNTGTKSYGVIAQQIEKIIPDVVLEENNNKTVNYSAIIGFLIEAIKELAQKIEKLENR